jgi:DNA-directed RNA polymerase specialized sigma24 family protein
MKNKTSQILLSHIQTHSQSFLVFAFKMCKRKEVAEDILQNVICKLLRKPIEYDVNNKNQFIFKMITQMYSNYRAVNKKYYQVGDAGINNPNFEESEFMDTLAQNTTPCEYQEDLMFTLQLQEVRRRAKTLPPKQKEMIFKALSGQDIDEKLGVGPVSNNPGYNTLKASRRHAILKLKV